MGAASFPRAAAARRRPRASDGHPSPHRRRSLHSAPFGGDESLRFGRYSSASGYATTINDSIGCALTFAAVVTRRAYHIFRSSDERFRCFNVKRCVLDGILYQIITGEPTAFSNSSLSRPGWPVATAGRDRVRLRSSRHGVRVRHSVAAQAALGQRQEGRRKQHALFGNGGWVCRYSSSHFRTFINLSFLISAYCLGKQLHSICISRRAYICKLTLRGPLEFAKMHFSEFGSKTFV